MKLNVWPFHAGMGSDETCGFKMIACAQIGLEQNPAHADEQLADGPHMSVQRHGKLCLILDDGFQMVVEIFPHTRQFMKHIDAGFP